MISRILAWVILIFGGLSLGIYLDINHFSLFWYSWIWHLFSFFIGLALLKLVIKISKNTGRTLAKHGKRGQLKRMETNQLVKEGVYSYMRHPMHLGLFLFPMSFAFLSGSLSFILIIAPLEIILMLIMIYTIEEPEAIKKFGNDYLEYKKQVPAFSFSKQSIQKLLTNQAKN